MAAPVLTPRKDSEIPEKDFGWSGGGGGDNGGGGGGGGWNPGGAVPTDVSLAGVWVAIVAIIMLFAALSGVMLLRRHISQQWTETPLPNLIYLNSAVLLISSLTLEFSRASLTAGLSRRFLLWLYTTLTLGLGFIAGQIILWHELVERGIYLATDPSSSFLYLLTGAHALHLAGGVIALLVLVAEGRRIACGTKSRALLDATAIYWHFMYALWIYILLLLVLKL
jgi:cytochrome c oxidase subunit III